MLAALVRLGVLAFLVTLYWPGPLTVSANSSDNFLPFARTDGSLAFAVLDTRYGAAGVWVWNQRERSAHAAVAR